MRTPRSHVVFAGALARLLAASVAAAQGAPPPVPAPPAAPHAAASNAPTTPPLPFGAFDVLGFRMRLATYLQGQFQYNQYSEQQLSSDGMRQLNQTEFALRRGRVLVYAERDFAASVIELDGSTSNAGFRFSVRQAEATLRIPPPHHGAEPTLLGLTAGEFRVPFGYDNVLSARSRYFMENAQAARAFFPGESDIGARLAGGVRFLRYALALTNGMPIDMPRFGATAPLTPRDVVGRLGVDVRVGQAVVSGGVSALTGAGFHPGTPATVDSLTVRDVSETGAINAQSIQLLPGRPATPSQSFAHWAAGADVEIAWHPSRLLQLWIHAEAFFGQNMDRYVFASDPIATGFDVRQFGFVIGYVQTLADLVVLGLRLDYYDPNADATARQGGHVVATPADTVVGSFLAGIQIPHTEHRLLAQYDVVRDHLAIGADGTAHDLANDRLTLRLQVAF